MLMPKVLGGGEEGAAIMANMWCAKQTHNDNKDDDDDNNNNNNNNNYDDCGVGDDDDDDKHCIILINETMSLNALKLICVTAAEWGKPMWQSHGLIPVYWNQLQNVDNTGTDMGSQKVEILNVKFLLCHIPTGAPILKSVRTWPGPNLIFRTYNLLRYMLH